MSSASADVGRVFGNWWFQTAFVATERVMDDKEFE